MTRSNSHATDASSSATCMVIVRRVDSRTEALSPLGIGALRHRRCLFALISGRWQPRVKPMHARLGGDRPSDGAHRAGPNPFEARRP